MNALRQPSFQEINPYQNLKVSSAQSSLSKTSIVTSKNYSRKTTKLSRKKRSSASLQLLKVLQISSSGVAAVMMLSSIGVYLSTVRIPQLWSQEYETLEDLQRQERQLVALDESLKYEIAQQAEQPELEMSAIASENTMFLQARSVKPQESSTEDKPKLWQSIPLGY